MTDSDTQRARREFVVELTRRLHAYGTTAQRLEGAVSKVARRLGVDCEVWSNPTGCIISFTGAEAEDRPDSVRVLRMPPGEIHLDKLCRVDAIAEQVLAGELGVGDGREQLRALDQPTSARTRQLTVLCFGLTSASVAVLLNTGWADVVAAGLIGLLIGALYDVAGNRPRLAESLDALSALIATLLAFAVATFIVPLSLNQVVIAALIVLFPGLTLTNAVSELASQQWVAGTARFAGAVGVLLKLTFGAVAAMQIGRALGWEQPEPTAAPLPDWMLWVALLAAAYAFAVLFRARGRDYPLVMGAACLAFFATRYAGALFGNDAGVFFAGLLVSAASNLYARLANRPGAVIRVPGIILLVPGSTGFRSLSFVFERDVYLGLDAAFTVITVLVSLVAGLLFGNLLIPPRRNL